MAKAKTTVLLRRQAKWNKEADQLSKLYLDGATIQEAAKIVGVSYSTAVDRLALLRDRWKREQWQNIEVILCRELRTLDLIEQEAWQAWLRSTGQAETVRVREADGKTERTTIHAKQVGDPRFLDVMKDCVRKRYELLSVRNDSERRNPEPDSPYVSLVPSAPELRELILAKITAIEGQSRPAPAESEPPATSPIIPTPHKDNLT